MRMKYVNDENEIYPKFHDTYICTYMLEHANMHYAYIYHITGH